MYICVVTDIRMTASNPAAELLLQIEMSSRGHYIIIND